MGKMSIGVSDLKPFDVNGGMMFEITPGDDGL